MRRLFTKWRVILTLLISVYILLLFMERASVTIFHKDHSLEQITKKEITIWAWDIAAEALSEKIPAFQQEHPEARVNIIDIPWTTVFENVLAALEGGKGELPDIIAVGDAALLHAWYKQYPEAFVDLSVYGAQELGSQFEPNKWNASIYEGKVLAIPWDSAPVGLFYRPDLFRQAGIDASSMRTWDDWLKAGLALQDRFGPDMKLMTADLTKSSRLFMFMLQQQGISIFNKQGEVQITDARALEALTILQKMVQHNLIYNAPNWKQDNLDAVQQNKVASIINGVWFTGLLKAYFPGQHGKWRVMLPPSFKANEIQQGNIGGSFLLVSSTSDHPELAYQFIQNALATTEGQMTMFQSNKLFPSYNPVYEDPAFHVPEDYFGGQKVWRVFVESVPNIPVVNYTQDHQVALEFLQKELNKVLFENVDPAVGLQNAAEKISKATGRKIAQ
jgi:lactose/L-arabinose transport system substrate-binding protein